MNPAAPSLERPPNDWKPFCVCPDNEKAPAPRAMTTPNGIGDRLRAAAFAEIQARDAFFWAANQFSDAPESLKRAWRGLGQAEDRHLKWLLDRMKELGIRVEDRPVSDFLWRSFMKCRTAREFSVFMANAEERGRQAGERFHQKMKSVDSTSAEIFGKIAKEEVEHIRLAQQYFGEEAGQGA